MGEIVFVFGGLDSPSEVARCDGSIVKNVLVGVMKASEDRLYFLYRLGKGSMMG